MSDIVDNRREKLVDTISRILESAESDRATPVRARKSFLAALEEGIVPAGEEIESILIESDPDEETQVVDARRGLWKVRRRGLLLDLLKRLFGSPLISAVERRLNQLQRQGIKGDELLLEMERLYSRYRMYETWTRPEATRIEDETPRVICSEALT